MSWYDSYPDDCTGMAESDYGELDPPSMCCACGGGAYNSTADMEFTMEEDFSIYEIEEDEPVEMDPVDYYDYAEESDDDDDDDDEEE